MKFKKIIPALFASVLLFTAACNDSDDLIENVPLGAYENGIFISNEGNYGSPNSGVNFISSDLANVISQDIYKTNNGEDLGNVFQSVGLNGDNAYLVVNSSNKIAVVNRYTFKKQGTVTSNLVSPRYIAFSNNQYFVTNNDFSGTYKLNIYKNDNTFVKSIPFDRYAEKVVEAGGNIAVQTDGSLYNFTTGTMDITGHSITLVNPTTNVVNKVVTLPDSGEIKDLVSYQNYAYALSTTSKDSYIYKINPSDGSYTTTTLTDIPSVNKLRIDNGNFYFIDAANKIYSKNIVTTTSSASLLTAKGYVYGFDVIDGKIFVSDAGTFTGNSTVYVYSTSNGSLLKTFTAGVGTNGFYKN